jgi:hypothetical protein
MSRHQACTREHEFTMGPIHSMPCCGAGDELCTGWAVEYGRKCIGSSIMTGHGRDVEPRSFFSIFSLSAMCMVCALSLSHLRTGDAHAWIDAWIVCRYVGRWHISTRGWNCWQCNVLYRRGHRRVSGMGGGWLGWTMYFASSLCLCLPVDMPLQRTSIIIKHVHTHTHTRKRERRERGAQ